MLGKAVENMLLRKANVVFIGGIAISNGSRLKKGVNEFGEDNGPK